MQGFLEHRETSLLVGLDCCAQKHADPPYLRWLLRARRKRPSSRRAAEECDEFASPHGLAPQAEALPYHAVGRIVHHGKFWLPMSALGQKRTLGQVRAMSALPPKADIGTQPRDVRFVPKADIPRCSEDRRHSITWSARASSEGGMVTPSALAVLRLITNSIFVDWITGRSAGFCPSRMRATWRPISR